MNESSVGKLRCAELWTPVHLGAAILIGIRAEMCPSKLGNHQALLHMTNHMARPAIRMKIFPTAERVETETRQVQYRNVTGRPIHVENASGMA
jgi:hypothetical protein